MRVPGYLTQQEAVERSGLAKSTLQRWRREGYGPPCKPLYERGPVLYIEEGFDAAVVAALRPGARPVQPIGRKVEKCKREAGLKMQPKGPDAAIVARLMKFVKSSAVRVERIGEQDHYYLSTSEDGAEQFVAIFKGKTLMEMRDLP